MPLLEIFLKSPCPVGEASHWVQTQQHRRGGEAAAGGGLWRFVPYLLANDVVYYEEEMEEEEKEQDNHPEGEMEEEEKKEQDNHPQQHQPTVPPSRIGNCMWIQTLPSAMQSSILTFLSLEHGRFRKKDLQVLAQNLKATPDLDFWVRRAAENLFQTVFGHKASAFSPDLVYSGQDMDDYNALPEWLEDCQKGSDSLFPWFPIVSDDGQTLANDARESSKQQGEYQTTEIPIENPELSRNVDLETIPCSAEVQEPAGGSVEDFRYVVDDASEIQHATSCISVEAENSEVVTSVNVEMMDQDGISSEAVLDPKVYVQLTSLRHALLNFDFTSSIPSIAEKIRALCTIVELREVVTVIKPWEADDEVTLQLVETLMKEQEGYDWSSEMLSSLILPKLLSLKKPASRILVNAVLQAGKVHQRATVDALLLPLILNKEGLNVVVCEVLNRIIKDCLHADHVSSFFQKLPFEDHQRGSVVCLPCHQCQISQYLVWTEPVFTFFQNILNHQMPLTQEAIDNIVLALDDVAGEFSKSLKFGNFLLCLVNKYASLLKHHKALLGRVTERTNTFMTKSILSKLARL